MMTQVFTGPPTITTHPNNQLIIVGMNVTFDCNGVGIKPLTYPQWDAKNIADGGQWINVSNSNSKALNCCRDLRTVTTVQVCSVQ